MLSIVNEAESAQGKYGDYIIFPFIQTCLGLVVFNPTTKTYFVAHIPCGNYFGSLRAQLSAFIYTHPDKWSAYIIGGEYSGQNVAFLSGDSQFANICQLLDGLQILNLTPVQPCAQQRHTNRIEMLGGFSGGMLAAAIVAYHGLSYVATATATAIGCCVGCVCSKGETNSSRIYVIDTKRIGALMEYIVDNIEQYKNARNLIFFCNTSSAENIFSQCPSDIIIRQRMNADLKPLIVEAFNQFTRRSLRQDKVVSHNPSTPIQLELQKLVNIDGERITAWLRNCLGQERHISITTMGDY